MRTRRVAPSRPRERGIALILTLLVLLILYAVVSQLMLSARLDYQIAKTQASLARIEAAIEASFADAETMLQDDLAGGDAAGGLGGALGGAGGGGGDLGSLLGGAAAGGGDLGAGGGGEAADSLNDAWAKPSRETRGGIEVTIQVEDENRKLNLLSILSEEEEFAQESKDRLVRLLDLFREETGEDLSLGDAEVLVRNLEEWMRGSHRTEDLPRPNLLSNVEGVSTTLPLTVDELLLVPGFTPEILYDHRSRGIVVPGLSAFVTVWTDLEPTPEGEDGLLGSERPGLTGGSSSGRPGLTSPSGRGDSPTGPPAGEGEAGGTTLGARINVNTAPRAVLLALLPPYEMPAETIEAILRFRNEPLDEESTEPTPEEILGLEEATPPTKSFATLDDLDQIPEFGNLYPGVKDKFKALLTTTSEVFTIWVTARIRPEGEDESFLFDAATGEEEEEGAGLLRRVRSVVLRSSGSSEAQILPLLLRELRAERRWFVPDFAPGELPY